MFVRVMNALLGLWLFTSAFLWHRVPVEFYNVLVTSLLVVAFGMASVLGRHGARKVNFALGVWLFISALALPHAAGGAQVNQIVCAVLLVVTSLFPHVHYQGTRTAA
jgi:hypothetical protein